ncbi:MAG: MFS transporter [Thermodesulfobacteriota bacterium]|nr:MAG: MFS transporter [Thermodesulfobacteriota bacterium]
MSKQEQTHKWLTLIAMTGSLSMIFIDQTVVSVALPVMQRDLGVSQSGLQWIVNAYVLALASTVALGGKLGDSLGRVRAFITGVILFAIASTICGFAPNQMILIAARVFQGIAAGLMIPASAAIVVDSFDIHERGKAMAIYVGVAQAFLAIGPLLGGALTEYLSWRWVFWINIPVGIVAILLTYFSKPLQTISEKQKVDLRYALMLILGLVGLVVGIQQGHTFGWTSYLTLGLIFGGLLILVLFAYIQTRSETPLIQFRLFDDPAFTADTILLFCIQFAMISIIVFGAIYLQDILHFTPLEAGFALMPIIVSVVVMSQVSGRLLDRVGVRIPALFGTALIAAGFLGQAPFLERAEFLWILPGMILLGLGIGLVMVATNTDALNRAPSQYRAQASGVVQTIRQMGATIGLASIGGLVTTILALETDEIIDKYNGQEIIKTLLSKAELGQTDAIKELMANYPAVLSQFHLSLSKSIAAGYYFAGAVSVLAFFVALFLMSSGKQSEDH